ncbi:MAG: hypothetical protein AAF869_11825 [Pseudomonadota bacterium]
MMNEADIVERLAEFLPNFLAGLSLSFTVVSAYIAAVFYFLRYAGFGVKLMAFLIFSIVLASLGMFVYLCAGYFESLKLGLQDLIEAGEVTQVGESIGEILSFQGVQYMIFVVWIIGGVAYLAMTYLTFLHPWRVAGRGHASNGAERAFRSEFKRRAA